MNNEMTTEALTKSAILASVQVILQSILILCYVCRIRRRLKGGSADGETGR